MRKVVDVAVPSTPGAAGVWVWQLTPRGWGNGRGDRAVGGC